MKPTRVLSLTLLFLLIFISGVLADYHVTENDFRCEIDDNEVKIEKYLGNDSEVTVPSSIKNVPVVELGEDCFKNNTTIKKVTISGGIREIEEEAFSNCPNLEEVVIPASVAKIERGAFRRCDVLTIVAAAGSAGERYALLNNIPVQRDGEVTSPSDPSGEIRVRDVKFIYDEMSLKPGETYQLQWRLIPENSTNQNVRFRSKNPSVATVSESGLVSAVNRGKTEIEIITEDGAHDDDCEIRVTGSGQDRPESSRIREIELNRDDIYLENGETFQLKAYVFPADAQAETLVWTSSNSKVATVDENGLVTAIGNGKAKITVMSSDGRHDEDCDVRVGRKTQTGNEIVVRDVKLDRDDLILNIGEETLLNARIIPQNAANKNLIWRSSNSNVATVDNKGNVLAVGSGRAEITVITEDGYHDDDCDVIVREKDVSSGSDKISVRDIDVEDDLYLAPGGEHKLNVYISPSNATDQTVKFESLNPDIATVDDNGIIKAVKEGKAKIIVTTNDGNFTDDCDVFVNSRETTPDEEGIVPVRDVDITDNLKLQVGEEYQLTPHISPLNATNQNVKWESLNPSVASVTETGLVQGLSAGRAEIRVITEDGSHDDSCDVYVVDSSGQVPVEEVFLNTSSATIVSGQSLALKASIVPSFATENKCHFESSDKNVAAVDSNGTIKAYSPGTALITALSSDNSKSAQCRVSVVESEVKPAISYSVHVQDVGWQDYVNAGKTAGTTGQAKRLEGIKIKLGSDTGSIRYKTHVQDIGWQNWVGENELSGTTGKAKRLEAVAIELTGELAKEYDIYYRVHAENLGWMNWAKNGENAGTQGLALRLEAIQINLVPKNSAPPVLDPVNKTNESFRSK